MNGFVSVRYAAAVFACSSLLQFHSLPVAGNAIAGGDVGGNCCSDLEQRVEELEATTARKGNKRVSFRIFGRINKGILHLDDGEDSDTFVVDSRIIQSRFAFAGQARIRKGWSAGYFISIEFDTAETSNVFLVDGPNDSDDGNSTDGGLDILGAFWWIKSDKYGTVSVGQRTMAAFAVSQMDLSGTITAGHSSKVTVGTRMFFRNAAGALTTTILGSRTNNYYDARGDVIRYDSPAIRGFRFAASAGEDDVASVALRYTGKLRDFQVIGAVGYSVNQDELNDFEQAAGSVSFLHRPTGLSVSLAGGNRNSNGSSLDQVYGYAKLGWKRKLIPLGATAFSADYIHHYEHAAADETFEQWGLQFVQNIDAAAIQLYASYSNSSLDNPTVDYQDINVFLAGALFKF